MGFILDHVAHKVRSLHRLVNALVGFAKGWGRIQHVYLELGLEAVDEASLIVHYGPLIERDLNAVDEACLIVHYGPLIERDVNAAGKLGSQGRRGCRL